MKLPNLPYSDSRMKQAMLAFGGVDYTPGAEPGQWEETENVSCREYPALVPRESREIVETHDGATALYVYDKIAEVIGTGFYYDGVYKCEVSPGRKQIVKVGDLIVMYPDKLYYNYVYARHADRAGRKPEAHHRAGGRMEIHLDRRGRRAAVRTRTGRIPCQSDGEKGRIHRKHLAV